VGCRTRDELLGLLARLRRATVGGIRAPYKPLLLLWLFGRFAAAGSSAAAYEEAGEPVSTLINGFGPPVATRRCALHHALFDLGVLGLTTDLRIRVSSLYVARSDAGRAVDRLAGQALLAPRPGQPVVELDHISWHHRQVFKRADGEAA
jgi:hypothetical protein